MMKVVLFHLSGWVQEKRVVASYIFSGDTATYYCNLIQVRPSNYFTQNQLKYTPNIYK
jgi:hypothetical protein